jgi:hypothetical protein
MSTFTWPSAWTVDAVAFYLLPNVRAFISQYSGAFQAVDLLGERFMMSGRLSMARLSDGGAREAFFNRLLGANLIAAWHLARPQPIGTQRGTPTLSADIAQGATSLPMQGLTNGATWLAGDMLGVGGQLFQIAADVTVSGTTATITIANRARAALSSGASVTWDKPTANWRLITPPQPSYRSVFAEAIDFELMQVW